MLVWLRFFLYSLTKAAHGAVSVATTGSFTNPVVALDAPDPGVALFGSTYVMVNTGGTANSAFTIRTSLDLVAWTVVGSIFHTENAPTWSDKTTWWAPEIHQVGPSQYNAYYTTRNKAGVLSIGVATATSPTGPFTDSGAPLVEDSIGAIDATFAEDGGKQYVIWKTDGNSQGKTCNIRAQLLAQGATKLAAGSAFVDLIKNDQPFEADVVEGPWIYKQGAFFYLFYSGSGYADSRYSVGVARSSAVLGPYEKACAPVMSQYAADPQETRRHWVGPGHCSVVREKNTGNTVIVYHAWQAAHPNQTPGREILVDAVTWGVDGWPTVGTCNTPTSVAQAMPSTPSFSATSCVELNKAYRFQTSQWADHGWTNNGTINGTGDVFFARPGNCGAAAVSFESQNNPGMFFRHKNGKLELDKPDSSATFRMDSSFMVRPGLLWRQQGNKTVPTQLSMRSVNYPTNYIRHKNGLLEIDAFDGSETMSQDGTFIPIDV